MCICELQLHRRYTGRRDDKGLGYTTATISSAHSGAKLTRACVPRTVNGTGHAAARSAGPGVTVFTPERAMVM